MVFGRKTALLVTSLPPVVNATSRWKGRCCHLPRPLAPAVVSPVLLPLHNCLRPAWLLPTSPLALRVWHPDPGLMRRLSLRVCLPRP